MLELGGADPFIVMSDANMSDCIEAAVKGRMLNNGQSCIAAKRFIVHSSVYDQFINGLKEGLQELKIGNPMDKETVIGPLARKEGEGLLEGYTDKGFKRPIPQSLELLLLLHLLD